MIEKECPTQSHADVDEVTAMLQQSSLEPHIPKKTTQQAIASARSSTSRLQENSTIPGGKQSKMLQSMGSSKMLQVSSSREFSRELTTNNGSVDTTAAASLPAFGKQKSIVSTKSSHARGPGRPSAAFQSTLLATRD